MPTEFALEPTERLFVEAGIPVRRVRGELQVQCSDATYDYLTGDRQPVEVPLLCPCSQRPYPHELHIHNQLTREAWNQELRYRWPWSLRLSEREELSA